MEKGIRNKKGSILDLIFIVIVLAVLSLVILVVFKVSNSINTRIQSGTEFTTEGKTAMAQVNGLYPTAIDGGFLFLCIGLSIIALVMASMVRVHPVFIIFFIIALAFIIFLSAIFSNLYQSIASNPDMIAEANQLVLTSLIMQKLPFIIGIIGSILALIMYKQNENQNGM